MFSDSVKNFTSHMTMNIKDGSKTVEVFVKNNVKVSGKTFKI